LNKTELSSLQQETYSRQIIVKDISEKGQLKLAGASVFVAGCGGLGSAVLYYLTATGIGHLGFCDHDRVSQSNLNRQILFTAADIGKPKAEAAEKRLLALNPHLKTSVFNKILDEKLAKTIIKEYDIVVDCLDNFKTRFLLNDICVKEKVPLIHAGVGEFYGQMMTVIPGKGPCLRCVFPNGEKPEKQKENEGIIGPVPGIIGSMQALEAVKYLLDLPVCSNGLKIFDGQALTLDTIELTRAVNCICSK